MRLKMAERWASFVHNFNKSSRYSTKVFQVLNFYFEQNFISFLITFDRNLLLHEIITVTYCSHYFLQKIDKRKSVFLIYSHPKFVLYIGNWLMRHLLRKIVVSNCRSRESLQKGNDQYNGPLLLISSDQLLFILKVYFFFFTKQFISMRGSTILSIHLK